MPPDQSQVAKIDQPISSAQLIQPTPVWLKSRDRLQRFVYNDVAYFDIFFHIFDL